MATFIILVEIAVICWAAYALTNAIRRMVGSFSAPETKTSFKILVIFALAVPVVYLAIVLMIQLFALLNIYLGKQTLMVQWVALTGLLLLFGSLFAVRRHFFRLSEK